MQSARDARVGPDVSLAYNTAMLRIGPHELDFPVIQAPLSGYSDLPMRRVARLHGAVWTFDEVHLDRLVVETGKLRRRILHVAQDDHPLGGQLMGADPSTLAAAAQAMVEAGYEWIDLNLACPVRKVLARGRGGALLGDPGKAVEIMRAVRRAVAASVPVTAKLRAGWDESAESRDSVWAILDGAFETGLDGVIVHPRTVRQRYIGTSDWTLLARIKRHVGDRVVLGSGDLFTAEDVLRMMEQTGVDGVTLARGCIGNPWLFAACRAALAGTPLPPPPDVREQGETIRRHLEWSVGHYGERRACRIMRKFGLKYAELHPYAKEVREAILRVKNAEQWRAVLDEWYGPTRD